MDGAWREEENSISEPQRSNVNDTRWNQHYSLSTDLSKPTLSYFTTDLTALLERSIKIQPLSRTDQYLSRHPSILQEPFVVRTNENSISASSKTSREEREMKYKIQYTSCIKMKQKLVIPQHVPKLLEEMREGKKLNCQTIITAIPEDNSKSLNF